MTDDAELLSRYAETRSETAFAELVERHLGMVYHAALRQLGGDAHRANDVAQAVFVLLAEKTSQLRGHPSLAGWLHTATRLKAVRVLREAARRQSREEEALKMNDPQSGASHDEEWAKLRPVIDDVLAELADDDREAVLLRFFEGKSYAEIGERLRLPEKSAHKRVERALEKTRVRLTRRGIFSTAALASVLGTQAGLAAPAGLAATVSGAVSASVAAAALAPAAAVFSFMASTKIIAVIAALAIGTISVVFVHALKESRETEIRLLATTAENERLMGEIAAAKRRVIQGEQTLRAQMLELASRRQSLIAKQDRSTEEKQPDARALLDAYPELKTALVEQWRKDILEWRGEDFRAVGLTPEQIEQAIAIEMRRRTRFLGSHRFSLQTPPLSRREYKEEMRAAIGRATFDRYDKLELDREAAPVTKSSLIDHLPKRMAGMLYYTDNRLTTEHASQLSQIVEANFDEHAYEGLSESGWNKLLDHSRKSLSENHTAALQSMYDQWRFEHEYRRLRREKMKAQKAGKAP